MMFDAGTEPWGQGEAPGIVTGRSRLLVQARRGNCPGGESGWARSPAGSLNFDLPVSGAALGRWHSANEE